MILSSKQWGEGRGLNTAVCLHGIGQDGDVFEGLASRLTMRKWEVVAIDLRGHGSSSHLPPWHTAAHVDDVMTTAQALGVGEAVWIGHSFGALVVASIAARKPELVRRLVLLDPPLEVSAELALSSAETDRLDWNFNSVDGAVNALLSSPRIASAPEGVVAEFARRDLRRGEDGRLRFSHCPSAAVVMWSEVSCAPPPIAKIPTLLIRPEQPFFDGRLQDIRYRNHLGELLTEATVPNGHNVLWESATETLAAVEAFLS